MRTPEQVQNDVDKLGAKIINSKNSFKELYKHLKDNEVIVSVSDTPSALGVVTKERFLKLTTSLLSPTDVKEVFLKNISYVEVDAGFLVSKVTIRTSGGNIELMFSDKASANNLKSKLNEAIFKANEPAAPQVDIYSQLEKLAQLKEKGILTEAEFNEQKQRLLS